MDKLYCYAVAKAKNNKGELVGYYLYEKSTGQIKGFSINDIKKLEKNSNNFVILNRYCMNKLGVFGSSDINKCTFVEFRKKEQTILLCNNQCQVSTFSLNLEFLTHILDNIKVVNDLEMYRTISGGDLSLSDNNLMLYRYKYLLSRLDPGRPGSFITSELDEVTAIARSHCQKIEVADAKLNHEKAYILRDGFGGLYNSRGSSYAYYTQMNSFISLGLNNTNKEAEETKDYQYTGKISGNTFYVIADNSFGNGNAITGTGKVRLQEGYIYNEDLPEIIEVYDALKYIEDYLYNKK